MRPVRNRAAFVLHGCDAADHLQKLNRRAVSAFHSVRIDTDPFPFAFQPKPAQAIGPLGRDSQCDAGPFFFIQSAIENSP